jgi:hypothetical protein
MAFASACLALGLLLPLAFHPTSGLETNIVHFFRGLLIGLSATLNLGMVWKTSRQRRSGGV